MKTLKKFSLLTIISLFLVALSALSIFAANEYVEEFIIFDEFIIEDEIYTEDAPQKSSDELLEGYFEKYTSTATQSSATVHTSRDLLNDTEKVLYDSLKSSLTKILNAETNSTAFKISTSHLSSLSWTKAELGCNTLVQGGSITTEAYDALETKLSQTLTTKKVMQALLSDCEYELFWFDKTPPGGMSVSFSIGGNSERLYIPHIDFMFSVSSDFAPSGATSETYLVDFSKMACIETAITNARNVIAANASKSNLEKLKAYRDYICDNVSYFTDYQNANYGHPWQMIYVFDGNSSTNVVCEGYSKAFKYLCDTGVLTDVYCYLATGTMTLDAGSPGDHMWNVVYINGKFYLVDITNSDSGSIGASGGLFLAGGTSSQNHLVHTIQLSKSVTYTYDSQHIGNYYTTGQFYNLSENSYETDLANQYTLTVVGGSGSGVYVSGSNVTITANSPAPNTVFSHWVVTSGNLTLQNPKASTLTFTMPKQDITISAIYHTHSFETWNSDQTKHWKECSCGATEDVENHSYTTWVSTSASEHWKTCKCGKESAHSAHEYNSEWKSSVYYHWKECECSREGTKAAHSYNPELKFNSNEHWEECDCGYQNTHYSHSYDSELISNSTEHWKNCKCGVEGTKAPHNYNSGWASNESGHASTCECGAFSGQVPHTYDAGWGNDKYEHWSLCACGYESEHVQHDFTKSYVTTNTHHTGKCECGILGNEEEHSPIGEWSFDIYGHYHVCICQEKIDSQPHDYSSGWQKNEENHWRTCLCGHNADLGEHDFKENVTKAPTCTEEGEATLECTCGYTTEKTLDKANHEYDDGMITGSDKIVYTCLHCTDSYEETIVPVESDTQGPEETDASTETDTTDEMDVTDDTDISDDTDEAVETDASDATESEKDSDGSQAETETDDEQDPIFSDTQTTENETSSDQNQAEQSESIEKPDIDTDERTDFGCSSAIFPTALIFSCIVGLSFSIKKKEDN